MFGKKKDQRPDSPFELRQDASSDASMTKPPRRGSGLRVLVIVVGILAVAGVGAAVIGVTLLAKEFEGSKVDQVAERETEMRQASARRWERLEPWNGLSQGMSKREVRELFGKPMGTSVQPSGVEVWEFNDVSILGSGASASMKVIFETDGRVCAWRRPRASLEN